VTRPAQKSCVAKLAFCCTGPGSVQAKIVLTKFVLQLRLSRLQSNDTVTLCYSHWFFSEQHKYESNNQSKFSV